MDLKEFEKQMEPKAKRSRLEPFLSEIFELKKKGYANWQICKYLEDNGVTISQEGLRKFIKSRDGQTLPTGKLDGVKIAASSESPQSVQVAQVTPSEDDEPVFKKDKLDEIIDASKQNERTNKFIKESKNPLLNRSKK